jgi:thermopsin
MGAQVLRNGSQPGSPMRWFDELTLHDPTATSAYFYVSGNSTTPEGTFYDTEFVFGGENDGESTNFNQLSASVQLFYDNSTGGALSYFPSYYSFGQDTAESADNIHVVYSDGEAELSPGTVNYVYLGSASGTSSLSELASRSSSTTTTPAPEFPDGSLWLVALVAAAAVATVARARGGLGESTGQR